MNKQAFAPMPAPVDCIDTPGGWHPWDDTVHTRAYTAWECSVGEIRVQIAGTQFSDGRVLREIRCLGDLDGVTVDLSRRLAAALIAAADVIERIEQP
jgi:hypothetical protein